MTAGHDQTQLGPHCLGLLDQREQVAVDDHITWCADCRVAAADLAAVRDLLGTVPPEAFLEGPPENAELLVRRTLRTIRRGRAAGRDDRRRLVTVVGFAAAAVVVFAAGNATGHLGRSPAATVSPASTGGLPAGTRTWSATDVASGVRMTALVLSEPGWVQVRAHFFGVPPGTPCRLLVRSRQGAQEVALSWIAPRDQPSSGVALSGAAVVAPDDIGAIEVVTFDGRQLVAATG